LSKEKDKEEKKEYWHGGMRGGEAMEDFK